MKQNPFKIILKSVLVTLATIAAAVVAFLFSQGGVLRNELLHAPVTTASAADAHIEDGPPCDEAVSPGDIYQGRRMAIDVPDLGINQTATVDVAHEFNQKCLKGRFADDEIHGGFSTATITYDMNNLTNSWDTMERALALGAPEGIEGMKEGFELTEISVWDNDFTNADTTPHAEQDFPNSCNVMYTRRREGRRNDGQPRVQERASLGSFCCSNGWGTEEYLENPAEAYIGEGMDPYDEKFKNWFESSPEPDEDGNPTNGYSGFMTGHDTLRWEQTTQSVDITFEQIPATHMKKNFNYTIPYPGLLFKHLADRGQGIGYYRSSAVGFMDDKQAGNGEWDDVDTSVGCDMSVEIPLPWDAPDDRNWVVPTAYPCPSATPEHDANGKVAWAHNEPYVDENNNGEYDCPDPSDDATCEDFADIGNGYARPTDGGEADIWTFEAGSGSIDQTVAPELTFNRQRIDIAGSPKGRAIPYSPVTIFYPLTNIHIKGIFEAYSQTQCNCRPTDKAGETSISPTGQKFVGCQATFGDTFEPAQCGFCGSNQPLLSGEELPNSLAARGYQKAYCEDSLPRVTDVRWPPINFNTYSFNWELSSGSLTAVFDSILKDTGQLPQVDINVAPVSPRKGDSVHVAAIPLSFFQNPKDMYFAWLINGKTQQGLVAGAAERVPGHQAPPDFVEQVPASADLPNGATLVHKETREFYFAPKRPVKIDANNDGMDDGWEMRYFGTTSVDAAADPDKDGYTPSDFASIRPSIFASGSNNSKETYADEKRFMYITPGVWLGKKTSSCSQVFIVPDNFNPEWFPEDRLPGCTTQQSGLSNAEEYVWGTNPTDADTDDDGFPDGADLVGVGQMQWSYVNETGPLDTNRDKVGVIVLGKGSQVSEAQADTLTQIVCVDKTIYPGSNNQIDLQVNLDPTTPVPGEPLTITVNNGDPSIKDGFLTYDWKINGVSKGEEEQGKNTLEMSAEETQGLVTGQLLNIEVTAYNNNPNQQSYGGVGSVSKSIPIGLRYDSLEITQHRADTNEDEVVFPFPSENLTDANRAEALATQLKKNIVINRSDDVKISITNVWSDSISKNLYFEWTADGLLQNKKDAGKGSGVGSGYASYTFNPKEFLPNDLTSIDLPPKNLEVIGRAIDTATQKEVLKIDLHFAYDNPGITISEEGSEDTGQLALRANTTSLADAGSLYYTWKIGDKTISEGKGLSSIKLSYLQASAAPIVQLTVADLSGTTAKQVTVEKQINIFDSNLSLRQKIGYGAYGFLLNMRYNSVKVAYVFLTFNLVFFAFYGFYLAFKKKTPQHHARQV